MLADTTRRARVDFVALHGDTFKPDPIAFTVDNTPEDFSDAALVMQIRKRGKLKKELTIDNGITVDANNVSIEISAEDMESFVPYVYDYDLQKTKDGKVSTILFGNFSVIKDVTK